MQSLSCPSAAIPPAAHCAALRGALSEDDSNLPGAGGGADMVSLTDQWEQHVVMTLRKPVGL